MLDPCVTLKGPSARTPYWGARPVMAEGGDKHPLADKLKSALDALSIGDNKSRPKSNYAFWSTQPVSQFGEAEEGSSSATGVRDGP